MTTSTLTNGWTSIPLKFLFACRVIGAWGEEPKDSQGLICIRTADFLTDKINHKITNLTKREYDPREIVTRQLQPGDLIIEKSGGGDNQPVGRVISFDLDEPALCSNFLELLRPDPKILYSRFGAYLLYSLWSNRVVFLFIKQTTGIQNLDIEEYFSHKVKIPPLSEQQAIANYLDHETVKIDKLISAKERLLDLLTEKRQSLITNVITCGLNPDVPMRDSGIEWIGNIPQHWNIKRIKFLIHGIDTGFSPQCYNFPAQEGEWGVLKTGCVNGGIFNPQENKTLPPEIELPLEIEVKKDDILMSRASGSTDLIGSVALVENQPNERLLLSDKIFRLRLNTEICDANFFVITMGSLIIRQQILQFVSGAEGLANNITQSDIRELLIPIPPIEEQIKIVSFIKEKISTIDTLSQVALKTINYLQERRTALITAAVTGQISIKK